MLRKVLLFVFALIIGLQTANAIFISPGKYHVQFEPNMEGDFNIIVGDATDVDVELSGALSKYATITKIIDAPPEFKMSGKLIMVHMKLPSFIDTPGKNEIDVRAREKGNGQGAVGTQIELICPIYIHVPYPGVYVTVDFNAPNVNENETVSFQFKASNFGWDNLTGVHGEVSVLGPNKEFIKNINTKTERLGSREENKNFDAPWESKGYRAGDYSATAKFYYNENITAWNRTFKIGNLEIFLTNYSRQVKYQAISPFFVKVRSGWNLKLNNVYAIVELQNKKMQTPSVSLEPWQDLELSGFFDSTGLSPGKYPAKITIHYEDYTSTKDGTIEVLPQEKKSLLEEPTTIYAGIIGMLLLVLITLVIIFLVTRRKQQT